MNKYVQLLLGLCLLSACQRVSDTIEPSLSYVVQDRYLAALPSSFASDLPGGALGDEVRIGLGFSRELDLYPAITAFKRAEFLCTDPLLLKRIQYEVLLCYYLGRKWDDVIASFERSQLRRATPDLPVYHDLLYLLYDSYLQVGKDAQASQYLSCIQANYPEEGRRLLVSLALTRAELEALANMPEASALLSTYNERKKSVGTAQGLNALLPGAGYLYLGQTQSAITAFLLNGLFIAASVCCFESNNLAAGIIVTSFEAGWYFGGIYGAGLEAKAYNERLYESLATPLMNQERLFPSLMLNYAF